MIQIIQPKIQKIWGWPAVINFILGGMAAGFYLLSIFMAFLQGGILGISQPATFKNLAPLMVCLGLLALTTEAGRPLRSLYLFRHMRRSWMSSETLACAVFILSALLDWFFPHMYFSSVSVIAAIGLLVSQGAIVYRACAVTAWNVPMIPLLFVTSGFATGAGLLLLMVAVGKISLVRDIVVIALICVILNLVVWLLYLYRYNDKEFQKSTEAMRRPSTLIITAGIGHMLPLLLMLLCLLLIVLGLDIGDKHQDITAAIAGLAIIVGGASQKSGIILQCGYLRGVVLK